MAEKTKTKKLSSRKESYEEPVADVAEKVIEKNPKASGKEVLSEIDKGLENRDVEEFVEDLEEIEEDSSEDEENDKEESEENAEDDSKKNEGNEKDKRDFRKKGRYDPREITKEKIGSWKPKTDLGREVKEGKIKDIDEILNLKRKILEDSVVDSLLDLKTDLISIGQSKGKFGGGKRRAWRQTQKKTKEGNVPKFSTMAAVGDENGHIGIGFGSSKETLPARDKAIRKAKLNIIKIKRACGAYDCACSEPHTIPFEVSGKEGSVKVILIPAPQGTGLVVADQLKKILQLAGVKDVYSKTFGKKRTTFNLVKACMNALEKTNEIK